MSHLGVDGTVNFIYTSIRRAIPPAALEKAKMVTKTQAKAALRARGFEIDDDVSGWNATQGGSATIDAVGRNTINGECRGQVVFDYTASRSEFWQMVIDEAAGLPSPTPCPHASGMCEFHDDYAA